MSEYSIDLYLNQEFYNNFPCITKEYYFLTYETVCKYINAKHKGHNRLTQL